ncbi:hypothetical protein ABES03_16930 [Neobacillus rhizosphaerae]|uniref:hypothetical protein n=1 Tax=Neobacillus rhizosphaerae TaxID=2880965 RepID=UPI003D2BDB9C
MKYQQKDFTDDLKIKIKSTESALKGHIGKLLKENKSVFAKKNLAFNANFDQVGDDPFQPGYSSSVAIGVSDKADINGELIDLHIIKIWECERTFLGMPTAKNIPGSKITGELLDETVQEVREELKEYIEEILNDV